MPIVPWFSRRSVNADNQICVYWSISVPVRLWSSGGCCGNGEDILMTQEPKEMNQENVNAVVRRG